MKRQQQLVSMSDNNSRLDTAVVVPLRYLNIFWRLVDFPLLHCETA